MYPFGPHAVWKASVCVYMTTPMISSQKYMPLYESVYQLLRQIAMVKGLLPVEERTCSFLFLLIHECAYFIDFLISAYKTLVNPEFLV